MPKVTPNLHHFEDRHDPEICGNCDRGSIAIAIVVDRNCDRGDRKRDRFAIAIAAICDRKTTGIAIDNDRNCGRIPIVIATANDRHGGTYDLPRPFVAPLRGLRFPVHDKLQSGADSGSLLIIIFPNSVPTGAAPKLRHSIYVP